MNHGNRIAGYQILAVLGYGANSTIYAVQDPRDHQVYALKRVARNGPNDQKFMAQAINEYNVASRVDHPSVRRCFRLKRVRKILSVSEILLVMELVDGRNLVEQRPDKLADMVSVFDTVSDALGAIHKAGFVHADIKPNNILVTDPGTVKIIDLGQSCPVNTVKDRIQGTPDYIAPEQVKRRALTARTDVFNFGATMYWCLTDNHVPTLIPKNSNEIGLKSQMELKPPIAFNPDLPPALNSLVVNCLQYRPEDRPESMNEVKLRLELVASKLSPEQPTRPTRKSR